MSHTRFHIGGASFCFATKRKSNETQTKVTEGKTVKNNGNRGSYDDDNDSSFNSVRTSIFYTSREVVYHNGTMKGHKDSVCTDEFYGNNYKAQSNNDSDVDTFASVTSIKTESTTVDEKDGTKSNKERIMNGVSNKKSMQIPSNLSSDTPFSPVDL